MVGWRGWSPAPWLDLRPSRSRNRLPGAGSYGTPPCRLCWAASSREQFSHSPGQSLQVAGLAGRFEPGRFPMRAPAEVIEGRVVGMGNVLRVAQDHFTTLHRCVQVMVFFLDGVFGLGLFINGDVGCLDIGLELRLQFLGADGRGRKKIRMWASRPAMISWSMGYNLAFGFTKPRKVKQNILSIYQPDTAVILLYFLRNPVRNRITATSWGC